MTATAQRNSFDAIAASYDDLWSKTDAGYWQRQAVWETVQPLFRRGHYVLDLGCGTGVDALSLMGAGVDVQAVDASAEMVRVARSRGVEARQLSAEQLQQLHGSFDGAISNFGVLNCFLDLPATASQLARLVRQGGYVALCYMGKFCAWETAYYLVSQNFRKALRRWSGRRVTTSLGVTVQYPSVLEVRRAFAPEFRLVTWKGIGIFVPPSYVPAFGRPRIASLAGIDRTVAGLPVVRALSDHRLLILERV